jgi:hypothetical protein
VKLSYGEFHERFVIPFVRSGGQVSLVPQECLLTLALQPLMWQIAGESGAVSYLSDVFERIQTTTRSQLPFQSEMIADVVDAAYRSLQPCVEPVVTPVKSGGASSKTATFTITPDPPVYDELPVQVARYAPASSPLPASTTPTDDARQPNAAAPPSSPTPPAPPAGRVFVSCGSFCLWAAWVSRNVVAAV